MDNIMDKMQEAAMYITSRIGEEPVSIGMVLGSGLGGLADELEDAVAISYKDIPPHFPVSTVYGHKGRLVAGMLEGKRVLCMQGRFHYYEGYGMDQVVFPPIQVMHALGIEQLLVTNAAGGGVNESYKPGDLMLISDHIKMIADSPMRGPPNYESLGERFFDMTNAYDKQLCAWQERKHRNRALPYRKVSTCSLPGRPMRLLLKSVRLGRSEQMQWECLPCLKQLLQAICT